MPLEETVEVGFGILVAAGVVAHVLYWSYKGRSIVRGTGALFAFIGTAAGAVILFVVAGIAIFWLLNLLPGWLAASAFVGLFAYSIGHAWARQERI